MTNVIFTFPPDTYRWLVSLDIIPNQGILNEKQLVIIPQHLSTQFESGYSVAQIISLILRNNDQKIPQALTNVKPDNSKTSRATNWNFIWVSFDDLRMQFDTRIKDLILQGEASLIVEIVKQLCDRDDKKDQKAIQSITIKQKNNAKNERSPNKQDKTAGIDIKKLNTQKDPAQAQSSLQFLIILLTSSFNMTIQQTLGLLTNQNKYLAHIIAKGINDNFTGVVLFYTLLNKNINKLKALYENDRKDGQSCLYAIKPGFISKSQQVSELTIELFSQIPKLYEWLISEQSKGVATLLLGMKRHHHLTNTYWKLLKKSILNEEIQFFTSHFKKFFRDSYELIEICLLMFKQLAADSYLIGKLHEVGVLDEWLELASGLFQQPLDFKLLAYKFMGEVMIHYPQVFQNGQAQALSIFRQGWKEHKITDFVYLIDEVMTILQSLADNRSPLAKIVYMIIIDICQAVDDKSQQDKKQYLIQNFVEILPKMPGIPTQHLIETYSNEEKVQAVDYFLFKISIAENVDPEGLNKIGQTIEKIFVSEPVVNSYLAPLIYDVASKIIQEYIGKVFVRKTIKNLLHHYFLIESKKKPANFILPQPTYFQIKSTVKKVPQQQINLYKTKQKEATNLIELVVKLSQIVLAQQDQQLKNTIKNDLLSTNTLIKQQNFKIGSKELSQLLSKKFHLSKDEQANFEELKKSVPEPMEQSHIKKLKNNSVLSVSRPAPEHIRKEFNDIIQKRKKQQQQKKIQSQRKAKEEQYKKTLVKKQLQKINLIRGFGGQAQLKQEGFWAKRIKQDKQLEIYPPALIQPRDNEYIDNLFKKYHRVIRSLFLKYTTTMHSTKSVNNFDQQHQRTQTITMVELGKLLKDYKLFFLTNTQDIQTLVREINIKIQNKRQTQQLDFQAFEQFLIQFSLLNFVKPHTITVTTSKGNTQSVKRSLSHLSHCQLVEELFNYLRQVFQQRGQNTTLFDEPQAAYFNETQVIRQFNKKLQDDPSFILPEGYKKITEKIIKFQPKISQKVAGLRQSQIDVLQILDEIIFESSLQIHILEPISSKSLKARVKPQAFTNIKSKLTEVNLQSSKVRALSTAVQRKIPAIPPMKILQKKNLSFGMKLGLSYVPYKDKLLGEQVAYLLDDILDAVEKNRNTVEKQKVINDILKRRMELNEQERKAETEKQRKRKERKNELQKMRRQYTEKKERQQSENKDEKQKKKQKQLEKQKKIKEQAQKYLEEQKKRAQQKRKKQTEQKQKQKHQQKKKKQEQKVVKQKFKSFNQQQIQKLQKGFQEEGLKKKKNQQLYEQQKKQKQELYKKLRNKIQTQDTKTKEIKQKTQQQITQLYHSDQIQNVFKQFEPNLKAVYDFLIKNTHLSLTERKHNNEIIFETWHYFNFAFQLLPFIVEAKDQIAIFKTLTKDKPVTKQYYLGLNYHQFQIALLRLAIKHKSVFNKLAEKIKEEKMTEQEIDNVVEKDIEDKEKNEFDEPKKIDIKSLLKQQDIRRDIFDDYGDISKVNDRTLKGLIYYLKVPKHKQGQQKRFRQILANKVKYNVKVTDKLKQKLNQEYALPSPPKKKKKQLGNDSLLKESKVELEEQNKP